MDFFTKYPEATYGLLGTFIGSLITTIVPFAQDYINKKKTAHYLAIRIVITLRQYLYKCWLVTKDDGLNHGQRDADGFLSPQVDDPDPIAYPEDIDWRTIDSKLAYNLLELKPRIESAKRSISAAYEYQADPPDFEEAFIERWLQYSLIGLDVISLEKTICRIFKIPSEQFREDLNYEADFRRTIKRVEDWQTTHAESQHHLMEELNASLKERK